MGLQLSLFQAPGHIDINPILYDFDLETTYHPPASPPAEPANPHLITFHPGATHEEMLEKWQGMSSVVRHKKLRLTFDKPIELQINRRKKSAPKTVHERRLFIGKGTNHLCHTNSARKGFYFDLWEISHLISMEPVPENNMVEKVRSLANRIHPNAWDDLKAKLLSKPEDYFGNHGYTVTSIASKFPDYVIEDIKRAFEEKSNYSYDTGGYFRERKTGRDLKVECKLCDDGIFRAWFSSEFPGCANGDYWLLLNPTTAAFKERD